LLFAKCVKLYSIWEAKFNVQLWVH